jgi:hypothetical protein
MDITPPSHPPCSNIKKNDFTSQNTKSPTQLSAQVSPVLVPVSLSFFPTNGSDTQYLIDRSIPHMTGSCRGTTNCEVIQAYLLQRLPTEETCLRMRQNAISLDSRTMPTPTHIRNYMSCAVRYCPRICILARNSSTGAYICPNHVNELYEAVAYIYWRWYKKGKTPIGGTPETSDWDGSERG